MSFNVEDAASLERTLIELNKTIFEEYVLRSNVKPLEESALDGYFVVTPGGIESKAQAIAGVKDLDVGSLSVENEEVRIYGSTALLAGTLRAEGELGGRPFPPLGYLSVYVKEGDEWRLAARSLTPKIAPLQR